VWLALCVPEGTPEQYKQLFAAHGFIVDRHAQFERVEVFHFTKAAPAGGHP
jgi:hypothetical protein